MMLKIAVNWFKLYYIKTFNIQLSRWNWIKLGIG